MYKTKEQKIQAVADFKKQDLSVKEYAEKIGVHMSTMYNWLKLYGDEAEKIEESATVEEKTVTISEEEKPEEGGQANNVKEKDQKEEETREEKDEKHKKEKEESLENPSNSEVEEVIIKDRIDNLQATGNLETEIEVLETKEEKKNVNLELNKVLLVAGALGGLALIVFVMSKRNNQPKQAVKFQPQIFQGGNVNAGLTTIDRY
jgi:transposase-like protein